MVEFAFDIRPLCTQSIIKVTSNLLPQTLHGKKMKLDDAAAKLITIIDRMGQLSSLAQQIKNPITTANKLQSDNQTIYMLLNTNNGKNGVSGILKVGKKDLYLFDPMGETKKVNAFCILDFYIHESCQRYGHGKYLFDSMLAAEQLCPTKCAIDKPSSKMLGFMGKHYGLNRAIPQSNNFVIYEGFFDYEEPTMASPNPHRFGIQDLTEVPISKRNGSARSLVYGTPITPVGRYAARGLNNSVSGILPTNSTNDYKK